MSLLLLLHAAAATQLPSLDAKCTGTSKYVGSSTYSARVSTWGQVGRGGWRGGVLGPNEKIYGIPTNATSVLELDPVARKVTTFGDFGTALAPANCSGALHCGLEKWIGGVLAPTGKIIGIPYAAESVLEIDPTGHEVSTFGVISSSVKRKWVEGVLARNGKIYAIPYDAPTILEIDPVTHSLETFGNVGKEPCKWYGGVLAPNGKIYAIPYASQFVMEISPEDKIAAIFVTVGPGWGKWSGGVLAGNGKIYGIPALATSLLEIDVNSRTVTPYGMLPGGEPFQDKWNGGVLAPNGKIYGIPWRSSSILEFDPETKAIRLFGKLTATNFTWHGGVCISNGRLIAVPYNSATILEIGERVCMPSDAKDDATSTVLLQPPPTVSESISSMLMPVPMAATSGPTQTFILALPGCPDGNNEACFNYGRRTWHSVMITLMKPETTLYYVRKQVSLSHFAHAPRDFCFLFKGHALDPSVEDKMRAMKIAVRNAYTGNEDQYMIFIDTTHCRLAPDETTNKEVIVIGAVVCVIVALVAFRIGVNHKKKKRGYEQVSIEDVERTSLCRVTKMCKKKLSPKAGAQQGKNSDDAASDDATMDATPSKSFSKSMVKKEIHL